jgi:hypothetical protein
MILVVIKQLKLEWFRVLLQDCHLFGLEEYNNNGLTQGAIQITTPANTPLELFLYHF